MDTPLRSQVVLVTGAAGFIGSAVVRRLLDSGVRVVGLDNLNDYYDPRLKRHRLAALSARPGFEFVEADIEDREGLRRLFAQHGFGTVINLAARAGVRASIENPFVYLSTNTLGTLNLLECMREFGVAKFVLASTSSLYAGQPAPFHEALRVDTPLSPYAASKHAAESMAYSYHRLHGIDVSVLRYFTVYGPSGRPDMAVYRFVKWIDEGRPVRLFGDGEKTRDFTYVDDIARGTVAACRKVGYEIINLGGGKTPVSMNTIIAKIGALLGKRPEVRHLDAHAADMDHTAADIAKAARLLGWAPEVDVDEGLARTVADYLADREFFSGLQDR